MVSVSISGSGDKPALLLQ